jgi:rhodanese-related sulfurtransferase
MGFLKRILGSNGRQDSVGTVMEISAAQLKEALGNRSAPVLVDVREPWEWAMGHLDGALHIPMGALPSRLNELSPEDELVIYCHTGQRSWHAAAFLQAQGYTHVASLAGGIDAWERLRRRG